MRYTLTVELDPLTVEDPHRSLTVEADSLEQAIAKGLALFNAMQMQMVSVAIAPEG